MARDQGGIPVEMTPVHGIGSIVYDKFDGNGQKVYQLLQAAVKATASGDNAVVAAQSGKKIVVVGWDLSTKGTIVDVKFVDGAAGTDLTGAFTLAAAGAVRWINRPSDNCPLTPGTTNTLLSVNVSAAQVVNGSLWYILV